MQLDVGQRPPGDAGNATQHKIGCRKSIRIAQGSQCDILSRPVADPRYLPQCLYDLIDPAFEIDAALSNCTGKMLKRLDSTRSDSQTVEVCSENPLRRREEMC
jgi:hypothetical protein